MLAVKFGFTVVLCSLLQLVASVYQPVRLDDINKLTFRKYEKTDGTYRLNQMNCTNQFQETCELYEPKAIICFHNNKDWNCQATQTMEVTVKKVQINCEPYPFSPERSMNGYVVRDSCYLNYELVREPSIFTNFNGIFIFYLISIVFSITFLSLAFKNRGSLKYSQFGNHQYFKLKTDEDDE